MGGFQNPILAAAQRGRNQVIQARQQQQDDEQRQIENQQAQERLRQQNEEFKLKKKELDDRFKLLQAQMQEQKFEAEDILKQEVFSGERGMNLARGQIDGPFGPITIDPQELGAGQRAFQQRLTNLRERSLAESFGDISEEQLRQENRIELARVQREQRRVELNQRAELDKELQELRNKGTTDAARIRAGASTGRTATSQIISNPESLSALADAQAFGVEPRLGNSAIQATVTAQIRERFKQEHGIENAIPINPKQAEKSERLTRMIPILTQSTDIIRRHQGSFPETLPSAAGVSVKEWIKKAFGQSELAFELEELRARGFAIAELFGNKGQVSDSDFQRAIQAMITTGLTSDLTFRRLDNFSKNIGEFRKSALRGVPTEQQIVVFPQLFDADLEGYRAVMQSRGVEIDEAVDLVRKASLKESLVRRGGDN